LTPGAAARRTLLLAAPWSLPAIYFCRRWPDHTLLVPTDVTYHMLAQNLALGLGFTFDGTTPVAYVGPAMPFALSLVYRLFGPSIQIAAIYNALLGVATALLLFEFVRRRVGPREAWIAYALYVLTPAFWTFYFRIGLEAPLVLLVLASTVAWTRAEETNATPAILGAGLLWGATTLCKPVFLLLPFFYFFWMAAQKGVGGSLRKTALLGLGMAIVILPWTLRNRAALGAFIPVATGSGFALYYVNHLAYDGSNPPPQNDDGDVNRMAEKTYPYLLDRETDQKLTPLAWQRFKEKPAAHAAMWLRKAAYFWVGNKYYLLGKDADLRRSYAEDAADRGSLVAAFSVAKRLVLFPALLLLAAYGAWRRQDLWPALWPLFFIAAYMTAIHMIFVVESGRYVLPLVPLMYVFTAAGSVAIMQRRKAAV
jgi:4-amino-4-deoxy-L-arabinose transferase-like glycosyltransferase